MCGLTGFLVASGVLNEFEASSTMLRMSDAIKPRGPDAAGFWLDEDAGIALAHRRLAILDLSAAGAQPMPSFSGRFVIAFNGEIYNHLRLRHKLESGGRELPWRGHSDTETLLACIEIWGIEETLNQVEGMFAIALWDRAERTLTLIRDRLGEKPLYYGWQGRGSRAAFLFGSDLSALRQHPVFSTEINRDALALYMRHNCIGGEYSIYSGVRKLRPGSLLTISVDKPEPVPLTWWSGASVAKNGILTPFAGTSDEAVNVLDTILKDSIKQQMISDVPLGAFLSGGIDSSTVVALMQANSSHPVKTFSIGFEEKGYDEAQHAKAVANHLGTDHTELYVTSDQAMAVIPKLPIMYSEPFADSSQIPTFLVSQLAREKVAVSLSGDGGDELFCGYSRYQMAATMWKRISYFPRQLRQLAGRAIIAIPPEVLDKFGGLLAMSHAGDKLHKGSALLGSRSVPELYRGLVSHWREPDEVVLGANEPLTLQPDALQSLQRLGDVERMMALDMLDYLPDDILAKVDRAAMAVSLETRVPFLNHRVVEFAWTLPINYKLRNGVPKWPLRQLLYRYVPQELVERPKMGFGVPIGEWLRGPLREWAETLISETRLNSEGFFNSKPIRQKWLEHLSGRRNWQYQLWDVLMFQAWLECQKT